MAERSQEKEGVIHRGEVLPPGMTAECFDALWSLFNERTDDQVHKTNDEYAIEAFEVLRQFS
jgi:hypothetical protein